MPRPQMFSPQESGQMVREYKRGLTMRQVAAQHRLEHQIGIDVVGIADEAAILPFSGDIHYRLTARACRLDRGRQGVAEPLGLGRRQPDVIVAVAEWVDNDARLVAVPDDVNV